MLDENLPGFLGLHTVTPVQHVRELEYAKLGGMKVADFTPEELKALIRESVEEVLEEHFGDPDAGLELREDFKAHLLAAKDEPGVPMEQVAKELGFSW